MTTRPTTRVARRDRRRIDALTRRRLLAAALAAPVGAGALAACEGEDGPMSDDQPDLASDVQRAAPGPIEETGSVTGPFAASLLSALDRGETNVVCSPLSAQIALAMVAAGAAGATREQMEQVLGGDVEVLGAMSNELAQHLATVGDEARENPREGDPEPPSATLVNAVWAMEQLDPSEEFLDALATWFGTGVRTADFADPEGREEARGRINAFVEEATAGLIQELVPQDALDESTRLVLVNALHLKAAWLKPLTERGPEPFTTAEGQQVDAEMLHGDVPGWYEDEHCSATALRGHGGPLALALVLPGEDPVALLDHWGQDPAAVETLLRGIEDSDEPAQVIVPAFDIDWSESLEDVLIELGMTDVFDPEAADLTGMHVEGGLSVTSVLQKAVITVDAEGMEAAAATAIGVGTTSADTTEPKELLLDRPFLFLAYETTSCTPLVAGWIGDPAQTR